MAGSRRLVLIAEDEEVDADDAVQVFRERPPWETVWATDGAEVLDYLVRRSKHTDAQLPDLIVLHLIMPKVFGLEVLEQVKGAPEVSFSAGGWGRAPRGEFNDQHL